MKKLSAVIALLLIFVFAFTALAVQAERETPLLNDLAGIFTPEQKQELSDELERISEEQKFDVAVCTIYELPSEYPATTIGLRDFADDYYDYNGFGQGDDYDGMVIVYSVSMGRCHISTCGKGIDVFSDDDISKIGEGMKNNGLYGENEFPAFMEYARLAEERLVEDHNISLALGFIICTVISMIVTFIVMSVEKAKYKTVRLESSANNYVIRDSIRIDKSTDTFLYSSVSKTARASSSGSSSGSSTHTSSSGRSHGGGGF